MIGISGHVYKLIRMLCYFTWADEIRWLGSPLWTMAYENPMIRDWGLVVQPIGLKKNIDVQTVSDPFYSAFPEEQRGLLFSLCPHLCCSVLIRRSRLPNMSTVTEVK